MTQTMRAVEISQPGGPDVLQLTERPIPEPQNGQVILKVAYAGVNRPDALQRAGAYDPPPGASDLPGLEASGEVVAVGAGVEGLSVGDQVCALAARWRICRIRGHTCRALFAGPEGHGDERGCMPARDLLYRLVQRLHARRV